MTEGGYYGWVAVFCSFYHHAFVSSAVYALSVFYGEWVEEFVTGRGLTSWILTLSISMSMGTGPIAASLCTKFGHRPVIITGSVICAVGFFLSYFATSIYAMVLLIGGLSGLGLGLQYLPSLAIIPFYFHKRRSLAVGIAVSGAGVGVFLYPPFLIWLEEQYTWRGAMLILSGISLNMAVCGALIKPPNGIIENTNNMSSSADDISSQYNQVQSQLNVVVEDTHSLNTKQDNGSVINNGDRHLRSPEPKRANGRNKLSSNSDIRDKIFNSNSPTRLFDSAYSVGPDHQLATSTHFITEAGSHTSLARSHADIYLSSSLFDLDEADSKRNDSLRQIYTLDTEEAIRSRPPSHLDSLLQLSTGHRRKSAYPKDSSRSEMTETNTSGSCCLKLPTKYIDILRNPHFIALAICYVLICFTCLVPVAYIVDRAVDNGVSKAEAALAFSMYGAGNLFGRIALGLLADRAFDSLVLCTICILVTGVSTCLSPLCGSSAVLHGVYGFIFGTSMGGSVTLTPLILVDLLGLDMVNRSFGLILVFHATGFVLGTPMAGWVFDATNSYTIAFIIHGAVVILAAIIFAMLKLALLRSHRHAATADRAPSTVIGAPLNDGDESKDIDSDVYYEDGGIDDGHHVHVDNDVN